jgi:putative phosphoesterase
MAARCIGVISDTHGLLREQVKIRLHGCDLIIHAGDVDSPSVLAKLKEIAPVVAVRGNMDRASWARPLEETEYVDIEGAGILVIHDRSRLDVRSLPTGTKIVIYGHSHKPHLEYLGEVLYLNPGSAGPRRFSLPISMALLHIQPDNIRPELIEISA